MGKRYATKTTKIFTPRNLIRVRYVHSYCIMSEHYYACNITIYYVIQHDTFDKRDITHISVMRHNFSHISTMIQWSGHRRRIGWGYGAAAPTECSIGLYFLS